MKVNIGPWPKYNKKTRTTPERKVNIKIDPYDTWSMDHTLALIIHPMLIQLKATKHGAPFVDDADVPENLRSLAASVPANPENGELDSNHFLRWDWVLDEMIWAFGTLLDDSIEGQFFVDGKCDRKGLDAFCARQQNGFRLFGVYFQALWD